MKFISNGKLIGSTGTFPPNFKTAYNANRKYAVSKDMFFTNKVNILAVRVYDSSLVAEFYPAIFLYKMLESANLNIALDGNWKFNTGG